MQRDRFTTSQRLLIARIIAGGCIATTVAWVIGVAIMLPKFWRDAPPDDLLTAILLAIAGFICCTLVSVAMILDCRRQRRRREETDR